jgi:hypothetical protein
MRNLLIVMIFSAFFWIPEINAAGEKKTASTVQMLMHQKLESAHGLLEGIVKEDFDLIALHAERLKNISKATGWHKPEDEKFLSYARSFQNAAEYLSEQSSNKNLDGVAMGHVRITLECMQCHNFVRAGRQRK